MTTQIRIDAHCSGDKIVVIEIYNNITGEIIDRDTLEDAESLTLYVYDNRSIRTWETYRE
jgi:hypothetical protein